MGSKVERAVVGELEYSKKHGAVLKPGCVGRVYPVAGFDIEADSDSAVPFLMAGGGASIDILSWDDVVGFLTKKRFQGSVNFFYNLQYDFEGLLKLLPMEYGVRLLSGEDVEIGDLVVRYVPKKAFTLGKGKKVWRYFDAWQYFMCSLAEAVKKNLPHEVSKGDFDTTQVSRDRYRRDLEYRWDLIRYCQHDAYLAGKLGELIVNGANTFVDTKEFYSSAGVSEKYFRSNGFRVPWVSSAVDKPFMQCYNGGRFEIAKRGVIDGVCSIDIKSAYPYVMSRMPILGDECRVKGVNGSRDLDARYGAYCINVDVPRDYLGLLPKKIDGTLCFPTGDMREHWVDKSGLELLDYLGVDYRIVGGVELFQKEVGSLGGLIIPLFNMKEDKVNYGPAVRYACKIMLNGLYGKLIQLIDDVALQEIMDFGELDEGDYGEIIEAGDRWFNRMHTGNFRTGVLFSPYYASHVTGSVRNMLVMKALDLGVGNVVGMHTDSLQYVGQPIESGTGLGEWENEFRGRIELVKCGMYRMIGDDGRVKVRSRGVGRVDSVTETEYTVKRRFGLNQAMRHKWTDLNKISDVVMKMDLNTDKKRVWDGVLSKRVFDGEEYQDSQAIVVTA